MKKYDKRPVDINKIELDEENPRLSITIKKEDENLKDQLIRTVEPKRMIKLMEDILKENSFNPSMRFSLISKGDKYIVLDGNRRILSVILMNSEYEEIKNGTISLFVKNNKEKINKFFQEHPLVDSVIYTDRKQAMKWIDQNHIISDKGDSTLQWHTFARKISIKNPLALNLNKIFRKNNFEAINLKSTFSLYDRMLGNSEIKKHFEYNKKKKEFEKQNELYDFIKKIDPFKFSVTSNAYDKKDQSELFEIYKKNRNNDEKLNNNLKLFKKTKFKKKLFVKSYNFIENDKIERIISQIRKINFDKNIDLINLTIRPILEISINEYLQKIMKKSKGFNKDSSLKNKFLEVISDIFKKGKIIADNEATMKMWKNKYISKFLNEYNYNIHDVVVSSFVQDTKKWIEYLDILIYEIWKLISG